LWAINSVDVLGFWFAYRFCWASITRILYGRANLFPIFAISWTESWAPITGIISPQFLGQGFAEGWFLTARIVSASRAHDLIFVTYTWAMYGAKFSIVVSFLNDTCWGTGATIIIISILTWAFLLMRLAECWAIRRWWTTFAINVL